MRYLVAAFALGLLIALHELGHLLMARILRVSVARYALGFGPALITLRRWGIDFSFCALPFGASVEIPGMHRASEASPEDPAAFPRQRPWKRALVLSGGSLVNYLLAVVLLVLLYLAGTHVAVPMTIGTVDPGSEAARAQLRPGDVISAVNGEPVESWSDLVGRIRDNPGRALTMSVQRGETRLDASVRPTTDASGSGRLGIGQQYVHRRLGLGAAFAQSLLHTGRLVADGFGLLWRFGVQRPDVEPSTPVLLVRQASDAASGGFAAFLRVLVGLSVALAVFYLLPIPALDGGRLLFVAIESARKRPVSLRTQGLAHAAGFVFLFAMIAWIASQQVRVLVRQRYPLAEEAPAQQAPEGGADAGTPEIPVLDFSSSAQDAGPK
jgi:regulator of sigma E protease